MFSQNLRPATKSASRILVLNSLDARYGSTYRIRALRDVLLSHGFEVHYVEHEGSILKKLGMSIRAALKDYDLLFTQKFNPITLMAIFLARWKRKPVIVDWDDLDVGLQKGIIKKWISIICEAWGPRLVTRMTTHSRDIQALAQKWNKTDVIEQGFDGSIFTHSRINQEESREKWGFSESDFVIGHLCTLTHGGTLDLDLILKAWTKIQNPSVRFFLIGGGPLERMFQKKIRALSLESRTTYTGLLDHKEIPSALGCLDVGVVFMSDTLANRARVSFKVIEYLAMNIPIVGHVVGETEKHFGAWITHANKENLAQTLQNVVQSKPKVNTAEKMQRFEWKNTAANLGNILNESLQGA